MLQVDSEPIEFEIVLEGRIELDPPSQDDGICGISMLTPSDMASSRLLANSDRWADDGVFSRDLIDLAMMRLPPVLLRRAAEKARQAYGDAIFTNLGKAIDRMQVRRGWLERCLHVMAMTVPRAQVWQNVRALRRVLPR